MSSETPSNREPRAWRVTSRRVHRAALVGVAGAALAVTVVVALATREWIGRPFPGVFVLPNRVIPSVGASLWPGTRDGSIFQRIVIAVDGKRVSGNGDAYRHVAESPAGAAIAYTLRHGSTTESVSLNSRTFSTADYWLIFGSYLATGLLYLLVGVLAAWLLPESRLGHALLMVGGTGGIFALTGAGIYDAGADLRIHALAESFFPATFVYLALVLARVEKRYVDCLGIVAWWVSLGLAIPYQLVLFQPDAYSLMHGVCETYLGMAGLGVGATLIVERARAADSAGPLLRAAVAGALLGIGVPAIVMVLSGLSGGVLPVNIITGTAFLFPLSMAYGVCRERGAATWSHPAPVVIA